MPSLKDWGKNVKKKGGGSGGKWIRNKAWKDDGKLIFWLHPDSMLEDRDIVRLPVPWVNNDDEKVILWITRFHRGDKDIAAQFLDWLADQEDIDEDEIVLRCKHGKEKKQFNKGELLGLKGYGYKGKVLNPKTESVSCIIPNDDPAVKFLAVPVTAGKKIWGQIESQMDERGDEGNPQLNPYPLKVTYDSKAKTPGDYYDASVVILELSDEVSELFQEDVFDVEAECDPDNEDTDDFGTTAEILQALCVVDCPILNDVETVTDDDDDESDDGEDEESEDSDDEEETEDDEDEEGLDPIEAGEAEEGESYLLEDDNEVTFIGIRRKKAIFEDDDGEEHKLALDDEVWPVESDEDEEAEDDSEDEESEDESDDEDSDEILVRDAKPGVWYLDSDDDAVKFLEYDEENDAGSVEDEEGDGFTMDGDDTLKKKE
jgi:hypothetical protein